MNILYIYQDEFPWDVRVEKIVWSLAKRHEMTLLSRNRDKLARCEEIRGVQVRRVGGRGLSSFTGFPAFFSPWWINAALSVVRQRKIDLIIVRDLPLCPLGLLVRWRTGVPVVFDMAENYPAMIDAMWKYKGPRPVDVVLRNPWLLRRLEKFVLPRVDAVWVVSSASKARIGMAVKGHVEVVGNTPTMDILDFDPSPRESSETLSVVYTGWVDEDRGLGTVIRAVALARDQGERVTFNVVGTGRVLDDLERLSSELRLEGLVNFLGWRSQDSLREIIQDNDVGIVPHHVTDHTSTTLPNKVFDYMALGKPVIVSNAEALVHLVSEAQCGLVFQDGDPVSLLHCLVQLKSSSLRAQLGQSGRCQIEQRFNWSKDETVMHAAVAAFDGRGTRKLRRL